MQVKILAVEGEYALVEYADTHDIHRVSVPNEKVRKGEVTKADLEKGIPYGVDWDAAYPGLYHLNWEMHRRGIWTYEDAKADVKNCRAAVFAATGTIISNILEGGS